jgi:hypothetical protein
MTTPGFSSRGGSTQIRQFPMRDEAAMTEMTPGWSNSKPVKHEAEADVKVVEATQVEDKAVKKAPARKSAK